MDIKWIGCNPNNYMVGRNGKNPEVVIIHWIDGTLASADATFQNPARKASAHYGIADKTIHQYVKEEDTSYNCGVWEWNLKSVSIEHEASPDSPLSEESYQTSGKLIRAICDRHSIPLDRDHIKGHNEIKATQCPGTINIDRLIEIAKGGEMTDAEKVDVARALVRARCGKIVDAEVNHILANYGPDKSSYEDYAANNIVGDNHIPMLWKATLGRDGICPQAEIDHYKVAFNNGDLELKDLAGNWYDDHVIPAIKAAAQGVVPETVIQERIDRAVRIATQGLIKPEDCPKPEPTPEPVPDPEPTPTPVPIPVNESWWQRVVRWIMNGS